jgi:hypothetical protein
MPEELYAADEVFITSTNRSVLGVSEIAGHKYAGAPGPVAQVLPSTHLAQVPPPQSMSVSAPFLTRSVHDGTWHTFDRHTALAQSAAGLHLARVKTTLPALPSPLRAISVSNLRRLIWTLGFVSATLTACS